MATRIDTPYTSRTRSDSSADGCNTVQDPGLHDHTCPMGFSDA